MHKPISKPSGPSINLNKFNYHSQPADLRAILDQPFTIRSLEISPHGKNGVIFIQTDKGSFVLKSNNQGPTDEFLNRMAALLKINVPQSTCYTCSELIFHKLIFQIEKFCQRDQVLYARMKNRLDFPFYQVLQYVPSISLAEVGKDRYEKYLISQKKLIQMGMCIGFDLLTNNSDRFKLLWGGDGNINNVLIEVHDYSSHTLNSIRNRNDQNVQLDNYVFIDHSGYLLDLNNQLAAQNFQRYMTRACNFQTDLVRNLSEQYPLPKEFDKLKEQIQLYTHYQLTQVDLKHISKGIIFVTNKFLEVFESRVLQELYKSMEKDLSQGKNKKQKENNYWSQYWNDTLKKINLKYLQEVFAKMAAIYTTYPEVVHKIVSQVQDQIEPKNTQFTDMENHPTEHPPPQLAYSQNASTPQNQDKITEEKESDRPESKASQNSKKSMLSNKDLFAEMKQRKWRQKLVKFREQNADRKQQHQ